MSDLQQPTNRSKTCRGKKNVSIGTRTLKPKHLKSEVTAFPLFFKDFLKEQNKAQKGINTLYRKSASSQARERKQDYKRCTKYTISLYKKQIFSIQTVRFIKFCQMQL